MLYDLQWLPGYDKEGHPLLIWRSCKHEAGDRDMDEMIRLISWWFQHVWTVYELIAWLIHY